MVGGGTCAWECPLGRCAQVWEQVSSVGFWVGRRMREDGPVGRTGQRRCCQVKEMCPGTVTRGILGQGRPARAYLQQKEAQEFLSGPCSPLYLKAILLSASLGAGTCR